MTRPYLARTGKWWLTAAAILLLCGTAEADYVSPALNYPQACSLPHNADTWAIRRPNDEEAFEFGQSVLVFEYWNSPAQCSSTIETSVYFDGIRFIMAVQVGKGLEDPREVITITVPPETPFYADPADLTLEDGDEPGRVILYPLLG